ncbi:MAG TPA: tyrosine-type recombinase/integrase, partial [Atribacterota bacterium]|nr:tyrosine-type recombinase/integrase [Atribacterota bacterium]
MVKKENENKVKSARRKDKGNGSASKTKRKDGRYQGYVYITNEKNEKVKKYVYANTQQLVKAKLEEIKKTEKNKPIQKDGEILFNDYAITFIEDIRSELAPRTIESYQGLIKNYLMPILKDKELNEIKQRDIQLILNRAHMTGRSVETRKRIQALTHQVFKNACVNNYIEKSPVVNLKKIKSYEDKIFPMIISEKEEKSFIEAIADSEYKVIFYLVLKTGMRISEALALEWTDIDFKNNIIKINKKVGRVTIMDAEGNKDSKILLGDPKSFNGLRDLKVPELLMKNLKEHEQKYIEKKSETPFVFSTS